jgi:CspA family cold shock protein
MATGTVKWFNPTKGYGFIQPQGGGKDVFVHISAVERAGLSTLNEGATVEYELVTNRGKQSAENLRSDKTQTATHFRWRRSRELRKMLVRAPNSARAVRSVLNCTHVGNLSANCVRRWSRSATTQLAFPERVVGWKERE